MSSRQRFRWPVDGNPFSDWGYIPTFHTEIHGEYPRIAARGIEVFVGEAPPRWVWRSGSAFYLHEAESSDALAAMLVRTEQDFLDLEKHLAVNASEFMIWTDVWHLDRLSRLRHADRIRRLSVWGVDDVSTLLSFTNLDVLLLGSSDPHCLERLATFKALRALALRGGIDDAALDTAPLGQLSELRSLNMRVMSSERLDPTFFRQLSKLEFCDVSIHGETDLATVIEACPRLARIDLGSQEALGPLARAANLKRLSVSCEEKVDTAPIEALPQLEALGLHTSSPLKNTKCLSKLPNLKILSMRGDAEILAALPAPERLKVVSSSSVNDDADLERLCARIPEIRELRIEVGKKVTSLEPLRRLSSLRSLELYADKHKKPTLDFAPIGALSSLESLYFRPPNGKQDLECLAPLTGLLDLTIYGNHLEANNGIRHCVNLARLEIQGGIDLAHLDSLRPLKKLVILDYSNGPRDASALSELPQLHVASLGASELDALWEGKEGNELRSLDLSYAKKLKFAERAGSFTKLTDLSLDDVPSLTSTAPLRGCKELCAVSLMGCDFLGDMAGLADCPNLQAFCISEPGKMWGFDSLAAATQLRSLKLLDFEQQCQDIGALVHFDRLEVLFIRNAPPIRDISPLRQLRSLRSLDLYNVAVRDFKPIGALVGLRSLSLGDVRVSDLSFLRGLSQLADLKFTGVCERIRDLGPLRELPALYSVDITSSVAVDDFEPVAPVLARGGVVGVYGKEHEQKVNAINVRITPKEATR